MPFIFSVIDIALAMNGKDKLSAGPPPFVVEFFSNCVSHNRIGLPVVPGAETPDVSAQAESGA